MDEIAPEQYFFNYAFPCADALLSLGRITNEQYDSLQKKLLDREVPSRIELEKAFEKAFERIKRLASNLGLDYWDINVMKKYWTEEHNRIINSGEGLYGKLSETFKDLCRVHEAQILEKRNLENVVLFVVEYDSNGETRKRTVFGTFIPNADLGEKVRIHHSYAIEKV